MSCVQVEAVVAEPQIGLLTNYGMSLGGSSENGTGSKSLMRKKEYSLAVF